VTRRVLVTGAAAGLGAALARRCVAAGDRVLLTDVGDTVTGVTLDDDRVAYLPLDVRRDEDWSRARAWCEKHWQGLDLLVNNAGVASGGRIDSVPMAEWDRVLDVNLKGVVRGCRTFVPVFKRQASGHLVNIASAAGLMHPPAMSAYNAAKAAVVALSETLAHELEPHGVTTSVVCPSFFRTGLAASLPGVDPAVEASARRLIEGSRLDADDVAARVLAGIGKGDFLVIPDRAGRLGWAAKRFARAAYDRKLRRIAHDLYARTKEA
jgi:NAD(P)-dependent dehydrogenase (short-subunit alcohol dehydrogenase family)